MGPRRLTFHKLLFFALVIGLAAEGRATTYYVDAGAGSDSNTGTSPSDAWQTVAKVNGYVFAPDDQVLFARGQEWRESLVASSDGTADHPITYTSFGDSSLANPKFLGSVVLINSRFQSEGNGLYTYSLGEAANAVFVNHAFLISVPGSQTPSQNGYWHMESDSSTIELMSATDPRSDGNIYTAAIRDDVVSSNGHNHLVFNGLDSDESAMPDTGAHAGYGFLIMGSTDVVVENSGAYRAGKHNFAVISSTGFIGRNLTAAYALPGQSTYGDASAYVSYGDYSTSVGSGQTSEWDNITADHMEDLADSGHIYFALVTHGSALGQVTVNNLIANNGENVDFNNSDNTAGIFKMTGGRIANARLILSGDGILVDGLAITGANATVDIVGSDMVLQNMLVAGMNLPVQYSWHAAAIYSEGNNNTVRFSTVAMDPAALDWYVPIGIQLGSSGFRSYGNVFSATWREYRVSDNGTSFLSSPAPIAYSDYNFFSGGSAGNSPAFTDGTGDLSFGQFQAEGFDAHSQVGNPQFTNASDGDYSLLASSAAVDGAALPGSLAGTAPSMDALSHPRPAGVTYDMGAYEFQGTGVHDTQPPTISFTSPANGATVSGTITLAASASDNVAVAGVQFQVDSANIGSRQTSSPYSVALNTTTLSNGSHTVSAIATDMSGNSATASLSITVANGSTSDFTQTVQAQYVNGGGEGVGYHGVSFSSNGIGYSAPGQWANYTIYVRSAGVYDLTAQVATGATNQLLDFRVDGVDVTGSLAVPQTGDWGGNWFVPATISSVGIVLSQGSHVLQAYSPTGSLVLVSFTLLPALPGAIQGQNFDGGGEGVGYHGVSAGTNTLNFSAAGQWANYTVYASSAGTFDLTALVATGSINQLLDFKVDGVDVTGSLNVPQTGDWMSNWDVPAPIFSPGITLTAGQHVIQAYSPTGTMVMHSFTLLPALPGTVYGQDIDAGGEGVSYHGASVGLTSLNFSAPGQWANYTVYVTASGTYALTAQVATGSSNQLLDFRVDGTDVTGNLAVPQTGDWMGAWDVPATIVSQGVTLTAGQHVIQVYSATGTMIMHSFSLIGLVPGTVQGQNVNPGGEGVGYHGVSHSTSLGFSAPGQWANYTVYVGTTGSYDLTAQVATGSSNQSLDFLVDGTNVTGDIAVPQTGDWMGTWDVPATVGANGISLSAGTHVIQAYSPTGTMVMHSFSFTGPSN